MVTSTGFFYGCAGLFCCLLRRLAVVRGLYLERGDLRCRMTDLVPLRSAARLFGRLVTDLEQSLE
jgi:hypothetical protein